MSNDNFHVYASDPGIAALLGYGSVINAIMYLRKSPRYANGLATLGIVGAVVNDHGVPNVAVLLEDGVSDLMNLYGPLDVRLGEGSAAGYEGNAAVIMDGLDAPRIVLMPVDLAVKTDTIGTGTDLHVSLSRTRLLTGIAGESDTEVFTKTAHGLAVGDTVVFSALTGGGTGAPVVGTVYTVATVPTSSTFTLTGVAFSTDITGGAAAVGDADAPAYVLPAGTRLEASGGYAVATLEPVTWLLGDTAEKTVRVTQAVLGDDSEAPVDLDTVTIFSTPVPTDTLVRVTSASATGDLITDAELVLRYQAALAAVNLTPEGADIDVIITDRNEAAINDALATHVADSISAGIMRVGVIAPPVGTSLAAARASGTDGNARTTLNRATVVDVHPGVRRTYGKDPALTSGALVTMPGQALYAALICLFRPEENPSEESAAARQMITRYGVAAIETVGSGGSAHWAAGLVTPKLVTSGGSAVFYRDGIMADGTEISTERTRQFLLSGLFERLGPYQKTVATPSNRESAVDGCQHWLQSLLDAERIAAFSISGTYDAPNRHLVVGVAVQEVGTMNVITIMLSVGADSIAQLGGGEAAAA